MKYIFYFRTSLTFFLPTGCKSIQCLSCNVFLKQYLLSLFFLLYCNWAVCFSTYLLLSCSMSSVAFLFSVLLPPILVLLGFPHTFSHRCLNHIKLLSPGVLFYWHHFQFSDFVIAYSAHFSYLSQVFHFCPYVNIGL